MLRFCGKCDNMVCLKSTDENKLNSECTQCGYTVGVNRSNERMPIYTKTYTKTKIDPSLLINKYTHLDPTLPRLRNKTCINDECPSLHNNLLKVIGKTVEEWVDTNNIDKKTFNEVQKWDNKEWVISANEINSQKWLELGIVNKFDSEVVFIKYDDANMKYLYVCTTCLTAWKN